jgi:hypothetical protein
MEYIRLKGDLDGQERNTEAWMGSISAKDRIAGTVT